MAIIILCLWSPSPKHRHDFHCHRLDTLISIIASLSSRQLLLLQLSLLLSGKVKQWHGDCISYNKARTIRLLPVADNFYKTWSSHTTIYISSRLDHITSQHALQKQVRRPLLCCCKFYVAATGLSKNQSHLCIKTTMIVCQIDSVLTFARTGRSHTRFNKSWRNCHPQVTYVQSTSVEPVSWTWSCNVSLGRFIQQYRWIKVRCC